MQNTARPQLPPCCTSLPAIWKGTHWQCIKHHHKRSITHVAGGHNTWSYRQFGWFPVSQFMINTDCQDTVPRDVINRRSIFIRVPSCSGFPVLVGFAQQILHLRLNQWLSVGRTCNLRNILKNHVANRMPRSCGTKKPKINCKNW